MKGKQCYLDYVKYILVSMRWTLMWMFYACLLTCRAKGERMGEFKNDKNWRTHLVYHVKQKWMGFS